MQDDTLFDSRLSVREFGSYLLNVQCVLRWTDSAGLNFPKTNPPIENYKFAQVESLLCAIERPLQLLTPEQALEIARSTPGLQSHQAVINDNGRLARWLLHADAHVQWKELITAAVKSRELTLLSFHTKLPITDLAFLDADEQPKIVNYDNFPTLCPLTNDEPDKIENNDCNDFAGYTLRPDGLYVNQAMIEYLQGSFNTLSEDETFELPWHPTRDYTQPALELPCTLVQLRTFSLDASLDCIDEDAVAELLASLSAEDQSSAGLNQAVDELKQDDVKPLERTADEELAALFDGVSYKQLAVYFPTDIDATKSAEQWKEYSARAGRNHLKNAAWISYDNYNPYMAGLWWIRTQKPTGKDEAWVKRRLGSKLPTRNSHLEYLFTGQLPN